MLDFGDIAFTGRGIAGAAVTIGLEHKKLSDLVQSLQSGRLQGHQLKGMLDVYDRCYLLVEGEWGTDSHGRITRWRGKGRKTPLPGSGNGTDLEKQLINLETRGGLRYRCCPTRRDTLRVICALYRYWTDVDLDEHKSHLAIHAPDLDRNLQIPISLKRQIAAQLPGVGYTRSQAVDRYFGSIREMVNAPAETWAKIEGFGKVLAAKIVSAVK